MLFKDRFSIVERKEIVQKSQQCLWSEQGSLGRDYLKTQRGLSEDTIRSFLLGYIPSSVNHQLQGRVILPVFDPSNNLIAISSRRIQESNNRLPVYWHESYEKSFYLYGITQAQQGMAKWNFSIVTEGQIDVMQLHNHGVVNAVGLCGNKMSNTHLSVIYRTCEDIVLLLDRDPEDKRAGQAGAERFQKSKDRDWKLSQIGLNEDEKCRVYNAPGMRPPIYIPGLTDIASCHRITVVTLPEEGDPDQFVRKHGIEPLKSLVREKLLEMRKRYVY